MGYFAWIKNKRRLKTIINDLIDSVEAEFPHMGQSAKDEIFKVVTPRIQAAREEIGSWKDYDTDYIKIACVLIQDACFRLLSSGAYSYGGLLNPVTSGPKMRRVHSAMLKLAVENRWMTQDELKQIDHELSVNIREN